VNETDFDASEWDLPPLEVDDAAEPPPERDGPFGGVFLGSELGSVRFTRDAEFVELGEAVCSRLPGTLDALMAGYISCLPARRPSSGR
jgi:hypothetical protein